LRKPRIIPRSTGFVWCLALPETRRPSLKPPPPRINIQLYVGLIRAHQLEIKCSGEASNGYHGVSLVKEDFNSLTWSSNQHRVYSHLRLHVSPFYSCSGPLFAPLFLCRSCALGYSGKAKMAQALSRSRKRGTRTAPHAVSVGHKAR